MRTFVVFLPDLLIVDRDPIANIDLVAHPGNNLADSTNKRNRRVIVLGG